MSLQEHARDIRVNILKMIHAAGSGHPGGSLSSVDILSALYFEVMSTSDKFVLSKGHAAPALYATLAQRGDMPVKDLLSLRKLGSKLQGHPDMNKVKGVDFSTGSLGQGFSASVGMALARKIDSNPGKVFVMLGDGELNEGLVWEAAMSAAHYKLSNLTAIVDYNGLQIDGSNQDVMDLGDLDKKWESFGWTVISIDGHDFSNIVDAFNKADLCSGPVVIIANTIKGKGVSFMENSLGWHGKAPSDLELNEAILELSKGKGEA